MSHSEVGKESHLLSLRKELRVSDISVLVDGLLVRVTMGQPTNICSSGK